MSVHETMWNELKNRVSLNISKQITQEDMISFMNALESHFKDDIDKEVMEQVKELKEQEKKDKTK